MYSRTVSLLQGGDDIEIILVDDGSTKDNTPAICDRYAQQYPDIVRAIHQPNGGHGEGYLLKVSRRTLQDYRNNGILPYTQVGGKILYRASDIEKTLMKGYKEAYRLNE